MSSGKTSKRSRFSQPAPATKSSERTHRGRVRVWVIGIVVAAACLVILFELGWLPWPYLTGEQFSVPAYASANDADGDGINDQLDILESARAYVATRPAYASAYYQGGWPNDGRGVCTDVVAYALLGAGYDLREQVNDDILADPAAYGIGQPDANIDYRRVCNLSVFFSRHATSLTTDVHDTGQWQGGDIVVFGQNGGNHIGIVSDRRDLVGVAFLIHHAHPLQLSYEEDALLWDAGDVTGHYRFG